MEFFAQAELFSRPSILARPELVPESRGIYAWFFREIPPLVPTDSCFTRDVLTLLYVGISPKNANSHQNLRKRIFNHYRGNAKGSTLRLTLGVLLTATSNHPLRRVGSGHQMTFTREGELWLNDWLERNAFVCWVEHQEPWLAEDDASSPKKGSKAVRQQDANPQRGRLKSQDATLSLSERRPTLSIRTPRIFEKTSIQH